MMNRIKIKNRIMFVVKIFVLTFLGFFFLSPEHDAELAAFRSVLALALAAVMFYVYQAWKYIKMNRKALSFRIWSDTWKNSCIKVINTKTE